MTLGSLKSCKNQEEIESPNIDLPHNERNTYPTTKIEVYLDDTVRIHKEIYGINNYWTKITNEEFVAFTNKLDELGYTLLRFPGGWESEHYDWINNTTPGWKKEPEEPGATASQIIEYTPSSSFVVRTVPYLNDPSEINMELLLNEAKDLVSKYGNDVTIWEIGNEWFLVNKSKRSEYLNRYASLAKELVLGMKSQNPAIQIFLGCDWLQPDDLATMKNIMEEAWELVDGINIHIYAGDVDPDHHIDSIQQRIELIKKIASKSKIYVSEWNAVKDYTDQKRNLRAASLQMQVLFRMMRSGTIAASIWPPNEGIEGLNLMDSNFDIVYPPGQAFNWMTESFFGNALKVKYSIIPAIAAKTDQNKVIVFLFGMTADTHEINIKLDNGIKSDLVTAEVMYSTNPDEKTPAILRNINSSVKVEASGMSYRLVINPGGDQRGKEWEIIKLVLRL